ncbi:MAG: pyridoxal phosphate-dependent aminotransferase [Deltaproteobacteria bacterium]|nr:MAG: pyridoxal phosphate-dependent aminotransferase [Deltaproteobacteria bacterium]
MGESRRGRPARPGASARSGAGRGLAAGTALRRRSRVPGGGEPSAWAAARATAKIEWDLTVTDPAAVGLSPDPAPALARAARLPYHPDPQGLPAARRAIAEALPGADPDRLVLAASTSEGYAWLFKLLLEPGEPVAVPRPAYPLVDLLAQVEGVEPRPYSLYYDGTWHVALAEIEESLAAGARAVVVVHPSNPVGATVRGEARRQLVERVAAHDAALIVDEVFLDTTRAPSFVGEAGCDTFVLSGLSKLCALPGVKLAWIHLSGPHAEAYLEQLLWIADTFLSVSAPVQHAAPELLALRGRVQRGIARRLASNRGTLRRLRGESACWDVVSEAAGWYAVLRLPALRTSAEWAVDLLETGVAVHPGEFYGLEECHLVASLLPPPEVFAAGMRRVAEQVEGRTTRAG